MKTSCTTFFSIIIYYYFFTSFITSTSSSTINTATAAVSHHHNRRILHQPLFPVDHFLPPALPPTTIFQPPYPSPSPSPSPSPQPQPQLQPRYPFSSLSPPSTLPFQNNPFFPSLSPPPPPPPPPPPSSNLLTFPANISSLVLPHSSSSSNNHPISHKLIAVIVSVSLLSTVFIAGIAAFILLHHHRSSRYYHLHHHHHKQDFSKTDSLRLFPPNTTPSDSTTTTSRTTTKKPPLGGPQPPSLPRYTSSSTSSEFLYLGTLVSPREVTYEACNILQSSKTHHTMVPSSASASLHYHRLGSPELHPLPPLPRQQQQFPPAHKNHANNNMGSDDDDEEEFFSPRGSNGDKYSPAQRGSAENLRSPGSNSHHNSSQTHSLSSSPSIVMNLSPRSSRRSKSPDSLGNFPAPPARERRGLSSSPLSSGDTKNSPSRVSDHSGKDMEAPGGNFGGGRMVPPPPPLPPPRFWETPVVNAEPPVLVVSSRQVVGQNLGDGVANLEAGEGRNENGLKPKLKPLHWDKVRASSDREMVWDQLKSSSFQLNEEMIETLFTVSNSNPRDGIRRPLMPASNQENQVLDPKKSQNIAILLRALNVTIEEVCESLLEGNADMLGTELLESLLKMAPTMEEEQKLMEFTDESPFKLGPAEKFLKAVLRVPYAFKRVDAMLYIANFDSEVEYLKRSFETLEEACKELRNSRMFLRLLEAVLKTGNRMNVGTNGGDAHAFKLDTLLRLVDVKGTDGRTTLLHFVVQEIIRAEGSRLAGADQNQTAETDQHYALQNEVEFRKVGLQVVSGLSGELSNVKKAASMDSDALNNDVLKLAYGIAKVTDMLKLNEELALMDSSRKFSESMDEFLKKAEEDIINIQAQEGIALSIVRELTEYFHGNSVKEEAHPFRIFMVVRDFLSILDQVCKDVGKVNERTIISSARHFPTPVNPTLPQVFPAFSGQQQCGSADDLS